jgi:hypothetical protein
MFCNPTEHSNVCADACCLARRASLSERAAWKAFQPYLDRVNDSAKMPAKFGVTLDAFVKEWRANVAVNLKGSTTRVVESKLPKFLSVLSALRQRQQFVVPIDVQVIFVLGLESRQNRSAFVHLTVLQDTSFSRIFSWFGCDAEAA